MSKDGGGAKFGGEGEIEREEKTAAGVDIIMKLYGRTLWRRVDIIGPKL